MAATIKKSVSILGLGWLGQVIGQYLLEQDFIVKGTTTKKELLDGLSNNGFNPYFLELGSAVPAPDFSKIFNSDYIIINIPPNVSKRGEEYYPRIIKTLCSYLREFSNSKILLISSTSVFGLKQGMIGEDTIPLPDGPRGKVVLMAEKLLQEACNQNLTILRSSGLVGPGREPGNGKRAKRVPIIKDAPINLIHQVDIAGIATKIILEDAWGEIFHGVSDDEISKGHFLSRLNPSKEIEGFNNGINPIYKNITNKKVKNVLNYKFKRPDLVSFFEGSSIS